MTAPKLAATRRRSAPARPSPTTQRRIPPLLSPRGLFLRALVLALAYAVAEAAGLRRTTGVLSSGATDFLTLAGGCTFVVLRLLFAIVAPICLLASGLMALAELVSTRRR